MAKKYVVCDSGSLITFTSSCSADLLYFFKEKFKIQFVIPPGVEEEVVLYPLRKAIKKYMQSALRLKRAIEDDVINVIEIDELADEREHLLNVGNNILYARGKPLHLVDIGETEMIVLAKEIGAETVILDERTTRMMIEAPFKLKEHLEEELGVNIMVNKANLAEFSKYSTGLSAFRSSELLILGYENGFLDKYGEHAKEMLEAALYAFRFSGCSISFNEITSYLRWAE
jgi:predicted nucleic acid-binding protein